MAWCLTKKLTTIETDDAPLFSVERSVAYDVKDRFAFVKRHNYRERESSWEPLHPLKEDLKSGFNGLWEEKLGTLPRKEREIAIRHRRQL